MSEAQSKRVTRPGVGILLRTLLAVLLAVSICLSATKEAVACTGIYVGSELTEDGSFFFGRSEDIDKRHRKVFGIQEALDNTPDLFYSNEAEGGTFSWPYAAHTYRFSYVCDASEYWQGFSQAYASAGQNELGVSASATVTTTIGEPAAAVDPLQSGGITEFNIVSILLGESKSAREGCELIGTIIDSKGAGEGFQFTISDGTETWIFTSLSGHQWIAFLLPSDVVSLNPNISRLPVQLDLEGLDVLHSQSLISMATENGFDLWFGEEKTIFDVFSSYGVRDTAQEAVSCYDRWLQGAYYFDSGLVDTIEYTTDSWGTVTDILGMELLMTSTRDDFSTKEILDSLAFRGEGTPVNEDSADIYSIGNPNQAECHFFQVRPNMPKELQTLEWLCLSRAEFSIYLPSYSAMITDVAHIYRDGSTSHDLENPLKTSVDGSLSYTFTDLNTLCQKDRENYGVNVKRYFDNLELEIIEQQSIVDERMLAHYQEDPSKAQEWATQIAIRLAVDVNDRAELVLSELRAYINEGNTAEPFLPSLMNEDGTNKEPLVYADYLSETTELTSYEEEDIPIDESTGPMIPPIVWEVSLVVAVLLVVFLAYQAMRRQKSKR